MDPIPKPQSKVFPLKITVILTILFVICAGITAFVFFYFVFFVPQDILKQANNAFRSENYKEAITKYEHLLKNYPGFVATKPKIYKNLGTSYISSDISQTRKNLETVVKQYPEFAAANRDVYYNLGFSYLFNDKIYLASANFSKFLKSNPPEETITSEMRFLMGSTFNATQKYYQAIEQLEKVPSAKIKIKIDPDKYQIALAETYLGKGKLDKALIAANKTLEIAPDNSQEARKAHLVKFLVFIDQNKPREAGHELVLLDKFQLTDLDLFEIQYYQEEQLITALQENWLKELEHELETSPDIDPFIRANVLTMLAQLYKKNNKLGLALSYLNKALEADPDYLPAYYALANIYGQQNDYQKALEYDKKAMAIDENDLFIRNGIGWTYLNLGYENNYDKKYLQAAEQHFKYASTLDPEFAIAHNNLGLVYNSLLKYDDAIASFQHAIAIDPQYKKPYLNLGTVYVDKKMFDKALEFYQKALTIDPKYALAYTGIGEMYLRQRKFSEAIVNLSRAKALDPDYLYTYELLAESYLGQKQPQMAINEFNKGLQRDPSYSEFYLGLADIYKDLGDSKKSEEYFAKGLSLQSKTSQAFHYNFGLQLKREGKLKEAAEQFETAIKLRPEDTDSYIALGQVYSDLGKDKEALALLEKAVVIDPDNIDLFDALGTTYRYAGDYKSAINAYNKGLSLQLSNQDPADIARTYENLGLVYFNDTKQTDLAEQAFINAIQYDAEQSTIYINLGVVLAAKGDLPGAISNYKKALQLDPTDAITHNNLGYALALQGKTNEAIVEFKRALEIDPNLKIAQENLDRYQNRR